MKYKIVHTPEISTAPYSVYYKKGFFTGDWILLTYMARSLDDAKQQIIKDILDRKTEQDLKNTTKPDIIIDSNDINLEVNNE